MGGRVQAGGILKSSTENGDEATTVRVGLYLGIVPGVVAVISCLQVSQASVMIAWLDSLFDTH